MSLQVAGHQTEGYRINTDLYEGPLDLLLDLIEKAELDITKLALAQVTDQYLDYLRKLVDYSAGEVSAFLVIAARLGDEIRRIGGRDRRKFFALFGHLGDDREIEARVFLK